MGCASGALITLLSSAAAVAGLLGIALVQHITVLNMLAFEERVSSHQQ